MSLLHNFFLVGPSTSSVGLMTLCSQPPGRSLTHSTLRKSFSFQYAGRGSGKERHLFQNFSPKQTGFSVLGCYACLTWYVSCLNPAPLPAAPLCLTSEARTSTAAVSRNRSRCGTWWDMPNLSLQLRASKKPGTQHQNPSELQQLHRNGLKEQSYFSVKNIFWSISRKLIKIMLQTNCAWILGFFFTLKWIFIWIPSGKSPWLYGKMPENGLRSNSRLLQKQTETWWFQ